MGVFQPGLLIDFACEDVADVTLNDANPEEDLATVEVEAQSAGNTVWFTAYVTWVPSNASRPFTLRIEREDGSVVCVALDSPTAAQQPITTAITCCDVVDEAGSFTYRLVGERQDPTDIDIEEGTFTAAVINT